MRKGTLLFLAVAAAFVGSILSTEVQGQRGQQPVQIPDGPGKELVSTTCTKCHGLNFITNSFGFSRDEWAHLFGTMIALPKDQADTIANYLATNFPEKPNIPKAVIVPGPVNVNIKVWTAPTLGQRPHDPLAARDGSLWWTGQYASRLGRVDTKTGAMKEYPLDTPNSGPHGLVEDKRRQRLVHGHQRPGSGQGRSEDGRGHRVQAESRGRSRTAHADLRPEGHPVLHAFSLDMSAG